VAGEISGLEAFIGVSELLEEFKWLGGDTSSSRFAITELRIGPRAISSLRVSRNVGSICLKKRYSSA